MLFLKVNQLKIMLTQKKFFKCAESRAICFGSETFKITSFTMKISFYLRFDVIFEISPSKSAILKKKFLFYLKI